MQFNQAQLCAHRRSLHRVTLYKQIVVSSVCADLTLRTGVIIGEPNVHTSNVVRGTVDLEPNQTGKNDGVQDVVVVSVLSRTISNQASHKNGSENRTRTDQRIAQELIRKKASHNLDRGCIWRDAVSLMIEIEVRLS
jgi:hypothetical protein